uniref:hypothetical protein n=1 Tax=Flavobacterium filum TaxID=370974 RepID=UPI0023EF9964
MEVTEEQIAKEFKFWTHGDKGITINRSKLIEFLNVIGGFWIYRLEDVNAYTFVKVQDKIVNEVSPMLDIKNFVLSYAKIIEEKGLHETLLKGCDQYFGKSQLTAIPIFTFDFQKDSKDAGYYYFKNGFVEVTKEGYNLKTYDTLQGCVWKNQIQNRDFKMIDVHEVEIFMFNKFLQNICNNDSERYKSLRTLIGYLLHCYKEKAKAVILTDTVLSDNAEGRTGKTLLGNALSYFRKIATVDGKNFVVNDRFKWQECRLDTQIVFLNDVKDKFSIEPLFTAIADGIKVEQKGKTPFTIEPKILITSNKTVIVEGGSAQDRVEEFEFHNFYSSVFQPKNEFHCWFFKDWNEGQWQVFDNLFLQCVQAYLLEGISKAAIVNLHVRKIIEQT